MVFALFGCGSKEASASQTEVPTASKSETADASKEVDVLSVEGVSFEPYILNGQLKGECHEERKQILFDVPYFSNPYKKAR